MVLWIVLSLSILVLGLFIARKIYLKKQLDQFYKGQMEIYLQAKAEGKSPYEACIAAIEMRFSRSENAKTKAITVRMLQNRVDRGELPFKERVLVREMLELVAQYDKLIQAAPDQKSSEQVLQQCFQDFKGKFKS